MRHLKAARSLTALTLAYLVLVVMIVTAFWRVGVIADRLESETLLRANLLCEESNTTRQAIRSIVADALTPNPDVIDNQSPEVRQYFHDVRDHRSAFIAEIERDLGDIECPPPPLGSGGLVLR